MSSLPKLYMHEESGNAYKVQLLAGLLNIKLEEIRVDVLGNEQHAETFLAINPRGQIPVLVDGDKLFTDSAAIITYLAGEYPDPQSESTPSSFWSSDVVEQATIIDWLAFSASWIAPGASTARALRSFPKYKAGPDPKYTEQVLKEATAKSYKTLDILEKQLAKSEWLALGRPTIADISCFPYIALAPMGEISLDDYPAVLAWIERIKKLPGFVPIIGLDDPTYRKR